MSAASPIVVVIDESSSRVITGTYTFDSDNGGKLLIPSGSSLPGTPTAKEVFWNTTDDVLYRRNDADTAWVAVLAGSNETLQGAYENGNTLVVSSAYGSVAISNNSDTTNTLDVSRTPASTIAGHGVNVSMGANTTGNALNIDNYGSGDAINVKVGGSLIFSVANDESIVLDTSSDLDIDATAGFNIYGNATSLIYTAGGDLELRTYGAGDITIDAVDDLNIEAANIDLQGLYTISLDVNGPGGAIDIGTVFSSYAQPINIGTASARKITVGSASASEIELNAGLLDINIGSNGFVFDSGAASSIVVSSGNLSLDSVAGELTFDDVGNSGLALSQSSDRTLNETGAGELLNGVTSLIGAINALSTHWHPNSATNPSGPEHGDAYFNTSLNMEMRYDSVRGKWLSVSQETYQAGRNGTTDAGVYYRGINGITLSDARGFKAPFNGTVVAITYTRDDTDSATFEVTASGAGIAELASSATSGYSNTINGDFSQGDILAIRNKTGGNQTEYVSCCIIVKWRV